jgi:hypothetical protein
VEAKTLKILFDTGSLANAQVQPYPMVKDSWMLAIKLRNGEQRTVTRVRTDRAKIYKSINAVLADVRKIGFSSAEVCL